MAAESGLRSHVLMELRYRHVMEDLETETTPIAVRLEPRFYVGKKAAGYTFLGAGSMRLLKGCIEDRLVEPSPDAKLIPRSYYGVWAAIHRAKSKAGLDPKIQTCHGFRKYFENALDHASIDHERKMMIEGHFAGTRARHYTDREMEELRELYCKGYPFINLGFEDSNSAKVDREDWRKKLVELENKLARQNGLEARLVALEGKLELLEGARRGKSAGSN
jgi:hypothetical protein